MSSVKTMDGYAAFGRIRRMIKEKYGNQRKCAAELGISDGFLSDMLNARCDLSPALLAACGLRKRVVYEVMPHTDNGVTEQNEPFMAHFLRSSRI